MEGNDLLVLLTDKINPNGGRDRFVLYNGNMGYMSASRKDGGKMGRLMPRPVVRTALVQKE